METPYCGCANMGMAAYRAIDKVEHCQMPKAEHNGVYCKLTEIFLRSNWINPF